MAERAGMLMKRSARGAPPIATAIVSLLLAACGIGAMTSPPAPTPSASETAVPTTAPSPTVAPLAPAPAFVRGDVISLLAGDWMGLAVADLNEDGKLDLMTTTLSRLGVVVILGHGDGTFEEGPDIAVAAADSVRAADLNGDGHLDLIATGDQLAVLTGKGDGTFEAPVYYAVGSDLGTADLNLRGPAVADVDADTIPDLVVANWLGSQLAVLPGKGDGTFRPALLYPCPDCTAVALGDLNGDGAVDVVTTSFPPLARFTADTKGRLFVFLNDGEGRLKRAEYDPQGHALAVALGDLNGDGALDVITGNDRSYSVSVLLGNGDGTLAQAQTYPAGNAHSVAVVDLDGDGKLDILSGSLEDAKVWFHHGTGDGRLIETQGIAAQTNGAGGLLAVDLDGDGKLDLALTDSSVDRSVVSIFLGR